MRNGIIAHPYRIDEHTVGELEGMDFVFIAIDDGPSRGLIAKSLTEWGISFIDVGMGIWENDSSLGGQLRISTSTAAHRSSDHRLPTGAPTPGNDYEHNIQVADLNALGAVLAVIKWKKLMGFYLDLSIGVIGVTTRWPQPRRQAWAAVRYSIEIWRVFGARSSGMNSTNS